MVVATNSSGAFQISQLCQKPIYVLWDPRSVSSVCTVHIYISKRKNVCVPTELQLHQLLQKRHTPVQGKKVPTEIKILHNCYTQRKYRNCDIFQIIRQRFGRSISQQVTLSTEIISLNCFPYEKSS